MNTSASAAIVITRHSAFSSSIITWSQAKEVFLPCMAGIEGGHHSHFSSKSIGQLLDEVQINPGENAVRGGGGEDARTY
jgi:hypothetical protein